MGIVEIPYDRIDPNPYNERRDWGNLESLGKSIREKGFLQDPLLRPHPSKPGHYQIVFGHRRVYASQLVWDRLRIPESRIRNFSDEEMVVYSILENVHREDLDPVELARSFRHLKDRFGYTSQRIGAIVGRSREWVDNVLSLLRQPKEIQDMVSRGELTVRDCLHVNVVKDPKLRVQLAREISRGDVKKSEVPKRVRLYKVLESIPVEERDVVQEICRICPGTARHPHPNYIPDDFTFFFMSRFLAITADYWELFPIRNFLLTAYSYLSCREGVREVMDRHILREILSHRDSCDLLFLDSGMISALRCRDPRYSERAEDVITLGRLLDVDILAHLDVPMEPTFLRGNNLEPRKALETTVRNAEIFLDSDFRGTKCFVVQGWTLNQYSWCIERFDDLGIFDGSHWVGIGTTCMRRPPNLYRVYRHCIGRIHDINPNVHVHAFGIARPEWIVELYRIGVRSSDSAGPDFAVAFNRFITDGEVLIHRPGERTLKAELVRIYRERTKWMEVGQIVFNFWAYWLNLNREFKRIHGEETS